MKMDARLPNSSEHEAYAFNGEPSFNTNTKDSFDDFFSQSENHAFGVHWPPGNFSSAQEPVNGYNTANQSYPSHNAATPLPTIGFPQNHGQPFSRLPNGLEYSDYGSGAKQALSNPAFDPSLSFGHITSNIDPQLSYGNSQSNFQLGSNSNQTISPSALQNYPNVYNPGSGDADPKVSGTRNGVANGQRSVGANVPRQTPVTREGWSSVASSLPLGKDVGLFTLRDVEALSTSTNAKRLHGYAFISKSNVEVDTGKITHARVNKRRSRAEVKNLLSAEKGAGPWSSARGPVLKKLKISASRSAIARSGISGSRNPATSESVSPTESSSDSDSEDGSRYDSGSEPESPQEPSPLPKIRPTDAGEAAEYDVVEAVWAPRKSRLPADAIRSSLTKYWAVIMTIRDRWKAQSAALAEAEEAKDMAKFSKAKRLIDEQRRVFDSCIRSTLNHGHADIVDRIGENPHMLLVFYQFLAERFKEGEYGGSFIAGILELLARWTTIDQASLVKTKLDKVLPKLVKKGDLQGKKLAQQILDSAANPAKPSAKPLGNDASRAGSAMQRSDSATSAAKPISNDLKASMLVKKDAAATNPKLTATQIKKQLLTKPGVKAGMKSSQANAAPVKVKTNHIAAKPSGMFASLQSASKKPGATSVVKKEPSISSIDRKDGSAVATTPAAVAAPKASFSFAETMANLNRVKEKSPEKTEDVKPPETEEERKRRLRKEERRKLRVSFKGDDELVQVKLIEHHADEELGHDDSMTRDVGDTRGEGQMLKMHKDLEDADDDEDYAPEEPLAEWTSPSLVDFSDIDPKERDLNCEIRGGLKATESPHRIEQEEREKTTLMEVYTSEADIPPTPREPTGEHDGEANNEITFGEPHERIRERETDFQTRKSRQASAPSLQGLAGFDLSKISDIVATVRAGQQPTTQPQPATQAPTSSLEAIFAQYANNQGQNNQLPAPMQIPQMQAPQVSQAVPSLPGVDMQALMASYGNPPQNPQQQQQPFPTFPPPDVHSILAQLGQQQQNPQQQQLLQHFGQYANLYHQQQQQSNNDNVHESRKRQMDDDGSFGYDNNNNNNNNRGKKQKFGGPKKPFNGIPTLPCKFWQEGKCLKGDNCTFLHEQR